MYVLVSKNKKNVCYNVGNAITAKMTPALKNWGPEFPPRPGFDAYASLPLSSPLTQACKPA